LKEAAKRLQNADVAANDVGFAGGNAGERHGFFDRQPRRRCVSIVAVVTLTGRVDPLVRASAARDAGTGQVSSV